jgi:hypothetical protein
MAYTFRYRPQVSLANQKPNLLALSKRGGLWEVGVKIFSCIFILIGLAGSSWAGPTTPTAPGPALSAGVIGMTLAAGVIYLIKRRNRI